jgi:hypothetical protein
MLPRFNQFCEEKSYLLGVSPATKVWYEQSLHWLPSEFPASSFVEAYRLHAHTTTLGKFADSHR